MINEFIVANSGIFVLGLVLFIAYVASLYIRYKLEESIKAPKTGTKKGCEDCVAMQAFNERIPSIEHKQEDLRRHDIPEMAENLTILKTDVQNMQDSIAKLFNLIEQSWLAQINRLETTLHQSMCFPAQEFEKLKLLQERGKRKDETGKKRTGGKGTSDVQRPKSRRKKGGDK